MAKRNKLGTPWGWEVQKQRIKITMIYISLKKLLKKNIDLNAIEGIFCDIIKCSIGGI